MRITIHNLPTILLAASGPIVALMGWGLIGAVLFLGTIGLLRQGLLMQKLGTMRNATPTYRLETIPPSHFAETVRWSMDAMKVPYVEEENAGIIGVFLLGRMVPRLHYGATSVGETFDIIRFLHAMEAPRLANPDAFASTPKSRQMEQKLQKFAVNLRKWRYHVLFTMPNSKARMLQLWGCDQPGVPFYQKAVLQALYPVWKTLLCTTLRIDALGAKIARSKVIEMYDEVDSMLSDGRRYLLETDYPTYIDYAWSSLAALTVFPDGYGGKLLVPKCRLGTVAKELDQYFGEDIAEFRRRPAGQFVLRMYEDHRY